MQDERGGIGDDAGCVWSAALCLDHLHSSMDRTRHHPDGVDQHAARRRAEVPRG